MRLLWNGGSNISCHILHFSLFCLCFNAVAGFFGFISSGLESIGDSYCSRVSCCDFHLNDRNEALYRLKDSLFSKLYGQHLGNKLIFKAVSHHLENKPIKALAIGMHGSTGTGKNYATRMIADSIYKKGMESPLVHVFAGKGSFPVVKDVDIYKVNLVRWIAGNVSNCAHSMFVFDECDKYPPTLLDVVMPFIDHHATFGGVDYRKAIFVFLTNNGGLAIKDRLLEMYDSGASREDLRMMDFHDHIAFSLFNEEGGFYKSDVIRSDGIDFYVPFLPLEAKHVRLCILDELRRRGHGVKENVISTVISDIQFGPEDHPIFSLNGCKRVQSLVTSELGFSKRLIKYEL